MIRSLTLAAAFGAVPFAAAAEERRSHEAHLHGRVEVGVVIEGDALLIDLKAPGYDVVGNERGLATKEDREAAETAAQLLEDEAATLFGIPEAAACKVQQVSTTIAVSDDDGGDHHDHGHEAHAEKHDDHGHETHADKHGDHGHEAHADKHDDHGHEAHADKHDDHGHEAHADEHDDRGHEAHAEKHDDHGHEAHADKHDDHGHESHAEKHDDHGHEDHAAGAHEHAHESAGEEGGHTEFQLEYIFACANPDALTRLTLGWFDQFERTETVEVLVVRDQVVFSSEATKAQPVVGLTGPN